MKSKPCVFRLRIPILIWAAPGRPLSFCRSIVGLVVGFPVNPPQIMHFSQGMGKPDNGPPSADPAASSLRRFPSASAVAIDADPLAQSCAARNAERLGLPCEALGAARVTWTAGKVSHKPTELKVDPILFATPVYEYGGCQPGFSVESSLWRGTPPYIGKLGLRKIWGQHYSCRVSNLFPGNIELPATVYPDLSHNQNPGNWSYNPSQN